MTKYHGCDTTIERGKQAFEPQQDRAIVKMNWTFLPCIVLLLTSSSLTYAKAHTVKANSTCDGLLKTLADGCSISSDCDTVKCEMEFVKKQITFKLKVNKCSNDKASVTTTMEVPSLRINWTDTFFKDGIKAVPGFNDFNVSLPSVNSSGVYVQVRISENDDKQLHLKVDFLAGGADLGKKIFPVNRTVNVIQTELHYGCRYNYTTMLPEPNVRALKENDRE
ncbi:hypothetical protein ACROYT_G029590 [Oculina patagonica]